MICAPQTACTSDAIIAVDAPLAHSFFGWVSGCLQLLTDTGIMPGSVGMTVRLRRVAAFRTIPFAWQW